MYNNLKAEMARKNLKQKHIAEVLGVSVKGVSDRISGRQMFRLDEASAIRDSFFQDKTIDYLFTQSN